MTCLPLRNLILLALALGPNAAPAATPSIEDYVRRPAISHVAISPSGTHLAMAAATTAGRSQVGVLNLAPLGSAKALAGFKNADITRVHWVNNDRLIFQAVNFDVAADEEGAHGWFAVNRDGTGLRELIAHRLTTSEAGSNITSRVLPWNWGVHSTIDDGSADIIVSEHLYDARGDLRSTSLWRLNTLTGRRVLMTAGAPAGARQWVLDGANQPRAVTTVRDGRTTIHWRDAAAEAPWKPVAEFAEYREGFIPRLIDSDGRLQVLSRRDRDTLALYRLDPEQKKVEDEPVVSLRGFDFDPELVIDSVTQRLMGVHYVAEQAGSHWFDAELRKVQQSVDAAMPPGRVNRLWCGRCAGARFFVIESSSDRQPGEYHLLDRQTSQLQLISARRPWIDESSQGRRSLHRVAAKDGLSLPVYITRPVSAAEGAALPAVVLVHGGPYLRGHELGWSQEAQLLASRGYLVLEVDFRGSLGYGFKHFAAGWKQWGRAMQDDLADAVAWAVQQGMVDGKRVCIAGSSYGGYAALMGPIRHPDLYKCAVSLSGVTDIDLMYDIVWSDLSEEWKQYGMPLLVGDRKADAEQLRAASPLQQAGRIKVPLLLAHGAQDRRVPLEHGKKFRAEAEKAGVQVEWVVYPEEQHGFRQTANEADFWKRVEAFLARSLGAARPVDDMAGR